MKLASKEGGMSYESNKEKLMSIDEIIVRFFAPEKEHIIVTDMNGKLVWKSEFFPYSFDEIL